MCVCGSSSTKTNFWHVAVGLAWLLAGWQRKVNKQKCPCLLVTAAGSVCVCVLVGGSLDVNGCNYGCTGASEYEVICPTVEICNLDQK